MLPLASALWSFGVPPVVGLVFLYASALSAWWTLGLQANLHDVHNDAIGQLLGKRGEHVVNMMLVGLCYWNCVSYLDFSLDLLGPTFSIDGEQGRHFLSAMLVWVVLLPLCSMENVSKLQPFSLLGVAASLYVVGLIFFRSFDGSYTHEGKFALAASIPRQLIESKVEKRTTVSGRDFNSPLEPLAHAAGLVYGVLVGFVKAAQFTSVLCVGFLSHYNASDYYNSLRDTTPRKFGKVSGAAFAFTAICYTVAMLCGLATFGADAHPTILRSYSSLDRPASIGRNLMGVSLLTSFPLMFNGLKRSFSACLIISDDADVASVPEGMAPPTMKISAFLLGAIQIMALLLPDVGLVVAVCGAIFGSAAIYALPGILGEAHVQLLNATIVGGAIEASETDALPMQVTDALGTLRTITVGSWSSWTSQKIETLWPDTSIGPGAADKGHRASSTLFSKLVFVAVAIAVAGFPYGLLLSRRGLHSNTL